MTWSEDVRYVCLFRVYGDSESTVRWVSHMQPMVLVYKNLHDWVIFTSNAGKYSSTMGCIWVYFSPQLRAPQEWWWIGGNTSGNTGLASKSFSSKWQP